MAKWKHTVKIKDILENDSMNVERMGSEIADRLQRESCFRGFPFIAEFRSVTTAEELDEWLERMYDYADTHRIWIT